MKQASVTQKDLVSSFEHAAPVSKSPIKNANIRRLFLYA